MTTKKILTTICISQLFLVSAFAQSATSRAELQRERDLKIASSVAAIGVGAFLGLVAVIIRTSGRSGGLVLGAAAYTGYSAYNFLTAPTQEEINSVER